MTLLAKLNLNYLRIFLIVYRSGSMTLAAKQLQLTQSGVSQQIKSLEETLGIVLFDRINRKIIPTDEAEQLYSECSKRLDDLENTLRRISNQENELQGRIKIGLSSSLHEGGLIKLMTQFSQKHPKVKVDFRVGLAHELSAWFEAGRIDFAFVDAFVNEANLECSEIASEPYDLVCHSRLLDDLPLGEDAFEAYCRLPFINYAEAPELLNAWFKKNFNRLPKDLNICGTVMDHHAMREFLSQGMGAGLLPEINIKESLRHEPLLKQLRVKATVSNRIRIALLSKRTIGVAAKSCLKWITEQMSQTNATDATKSEKSLR